MVEKRCMIRVEFASLWKGELNSAEAAGFSWAGGLTRFRRRRYRSGVTLSSTRCGSIRWGSTSCGRRRRS